MGRSKLLRRISLALGLAGLLTACAGVRLGQPEAVPAQGRLDVPQPTATQIGVGQNPSPAAPRMNPLVAQVKPSAGRPRANPYAWLENVHSSRTRHWIAVENRKTAKVLQGLPQREWIGKRLAHRQAGGAAVAGSAVVVEHAFYLSSDGTRLPIEIAHRRDLPRDGDRPALLTVYRATRKPQGPLLTPFVLVWLDMGGVYARAEVRNALAPVAPPSGAAAPLPDRSIALSDLFAAGQSLIDGHYTRRARLGIYGRGFGGLMAGAAVTLRPDFFGAALPTGTWPRYRQIATGNCFPPTLIVTAERGGDFAPWQGYELAAVLQAEQICGRPVLIRIDSQAGPGEPVADKRQRAADELAFAARWLGAKPGA